MNKKELTIRIRNNVFDMDGHTFEDSVIHDFINEGIDRVKQVIPEFKDMMHIESDVDVPTHLPEPYHHLLALYGTSRCFSMDERYHQSTLFMNEFEVKLEDLSLKILNGDIDIYDEDGEVIIIGSGNEYVVDNYFINRNGVVLE